MYLNKILMMIDFNAKLSRKLRIEENMKIFVTVWVQRRWVKLQKRRGKSRIEINKKKL